MRKEEYELADDNYRYFIGLDLGQANDYTAISVLELIKIFDPKQKWKRPNILLFNEDYEPRRILNQYALRSLIRPKLGTEYPDIVKLVKKMKEQEPLDKSTALIVDATGVGRPVVDMLRREGLKPIPITITGGSTINYVPGYGYHVPKRDLVGILQVMFQNGRIKIAKGMKLAQVFREELINFKVKINLKTAHDSYEAWREGEHDDLVLSVALAAWFAERRYRNTDWRLAKALSEVV
jgi:hypothetical protein